MFLTHSTLPDTCNKLLHILFDLEPFGLQADFSPIGFVCCTVSSHMIPKCAQFLAIANMRSFKQ